MNDILFSELAAAISTTYPDVSAWWASAPALPANTTVAEFFAKTLHAAYRAQVTKNATLAAGSRIAAYPSPTNGAVTIDTNGNTSYLATYAVQARVVVDLDASFAPVA